MAQPTNNNVVQSKPVQQISMLNPTNDTERATMLAQLTHKLLKNHETIDVYDLPQLAVFAGQVGRLLKVTDNATFVADFLLVMSGQE